MASSVLELLVAFTSIKVTLGLLSIVLLGKVDHANRVDLLLAEQAEEPSAVLLLELVAFPWLDSTELRSLVGLLLLDFDHVAVVDLLCHAFLQAVSRCRVQRHLMSGGA